MSIKSIKSNELEQIAGGLEVTAVKAEQTLTFEGRAEAGVSNALGQLVGRDHYIANIDVPPFEPGDDSLNSGTQGIDK